MSGKGVGIVTKTYSEYASPVMIVTNKNGKPRLVVHYWWRDPQTMRTNFSVANVDDQLEDLAEAGMYCALDLVSGYLQVPLTEEAKAKSAIITPTQTSQLKEWC